MRGTSRDLFRASEMERATRERFWISFSRAERSMETSWASPQKLCTGWRSNLRGLSSAARARIRGRGVFRAQGHAYRERERCKQESDFALAGSGVQDVSTGCGAGCDGEEIGGLHPDRDLPRGLKPSK